MGEKEILILVSVEPITTSGRYKRAMNRANMFGKEEPSGAPCWRDGTLAGSDSPYKHSLPSPRSSGCRAGRCLAEEEEEEEGLEEGTRSVGEASLTPPRQRDGWGHDEGGLSGALSAPLVQPWQVNWQGLHPEVGGLGSEHWELERGFGIHPS